MIEQRKHERVESRIRCWCEAENVTVYARIGNLSEGGLFLRTSTPLQEGARAVLRFRDQQTEVSAPARVVWTSGGGERPAGMGLQFESVDEQQLARIRELIRGEQRTKRSVG